MYSYVLIVRIHLVIADYLNYTPKKNSLDKGARYNLSDHLIQIQLIQCSNKKRIAEYEILNIQDLSYRK